MPRPLCTIPVGKFGVAEDTEVLFTNRWRGEAPIGSTHGESFFTSELAIPSREDIDFRFIRTERRGVAPTRVDRFF